MRRLDLALIARMIVGLTSFIFGASAVLAAQLGREHMARCGVGLEVHCGWCLAAAALALAALAMLVESIKPAFALRPTKARS